MRMRKKKEFHLGVNTLFYVPGDVGGTEIYLKEILSAIAQDFPRLPVTLFTNVENHSIFKKLFNDHASISLECLPFRAANRPLRILLEQVWLPFKVAASKVSLLWSPGYTAPFWCGCPQVVTIHDLQYKTFPEDMAPLERITLDLLVRLACRVAKAIISVSQFGKNELVRHKFVKPERVFPILEGVDPAYGVSFQCECIDPDIEEVFSAKKKYILCVAHTYPHKNVSLLVDAFQIIHSQIPHDLVIVGKARRGEKALQESLSRLSQPHRVRRFKNGVSSSTLKLLYQKADLFVLPSCYEGFGLPVLEAMMAGTPVIITRKASLPEVGGDCALYPEPFDEGHLAEKIVELAGIDEKRRLEITGKAKAWAGSFSWKKAAEETVKLCRMIYNQSL